METEIRYRTVLDNGAAAYHASADDSRIAIRRLGPGDTYAETWTRDSADDEWDLASSEHVGRTEREPR